MTLATLRGTLDPLSEVLQVDRGTQPVAVANRKVSPRPWSHSRARCAGEQSVEKGNDIDGAWTVDQSLVVTAQLAQLRPFSAGKSRIEPNVEHGRFPLRLRHLDDRCVA